MKGGKRPHGFTIVETLIVLAVTGFLFVSAVAAINGRQQKTQFQVAINDLQQQIQQVINETVSGYTTSAVNFKCSATGINQPVSIQATATPPAQGSNQDCTFLGKALWFGGPSGGQGKEFVVFPLAGNRYAPGTTNEAVNYGQAWPTAIAPGTQPLTNAGATPAPNDSDTYTFGDNMNFVWGSVNGGGHVNWPNPYALSLLNNLASYSSGQLSSGVSSLSLFAFTNTWTTANTTSVNQAVDNIDNDNGTSVYSAGPGVVTGSNLASIDSAAICLASGTTDQSGEITIGTSASAATGLAVNLQLFNTLNCT